MSNDIEVRRANVFRTPKINLRPENVDGSSVVESRLGMLDRLPKNLRCVELGVAEGGFSVEIFRRMNPSSLTLVDLWAGERYEPGCAKVNEMFSGEIAAGRVTVHRSRSVDFLRGCSSGQFDFIYIDTDHTFATTFAELCEASRIISEDGFICGHDYTVGNIVTPVVYGVIEAVSKFCVEYQWRIKYLTAEPAGWNSFCLVKI